MATPTIKWSRHQRERISKTLNELSFEPVFFPGGRRISVFGQEADDAEKRVGEMDFLRNGNDLEVKLRLRMHGYKVEVSIHSKPVDYVFESNNLSEEEAINHIKGYLEAVGSGQQYLP